MQELASVRPSADEPGRCQFSVCHIDLARVIRTRLGSDWSQLMSAFLAPHLATSRRKIGSSEGLVTCVAQKQSTAEVNGGAQETSSEVGEATWRIACASRCRC